MRPLHGFVHIQRGACGTCRGPMRRFQNSYRLALASPYQAGVFLGLERVALNVTYVVQHVTPWRRLSTGKAAAPFVPASCHSDTQPGPFLGPARERRKLKDNIQHEKRGIFACRSKKPVWQCSSGRSKVQIAHQL